MLYLYLENQREKLTLFFRKPSIRLVFLLTLLLNLTIWVILSLKLGRDNLIALHYNIYFGIDWFGPWYYAFILPGIGLAIILANLFLAIFFIQEKMIGYLLLGAALLTQFLLLIATILLIYINYG